MIDSLEDWFGETVNGLRAQADISDIAVRPWGIAVSRIGRAGWEPVAELPTERYIEEVLRAVASSQEPPISLGWDAPRLDCMLADGARFAGLYCGRQSFFTIRVFGVLDRTLDDYAASNALSAKKVSAVKGEIERCSSVLIVGAPGSGKTTFLNACLAYAVQIRPYDHYMVVEDTADVQCRAKINTRIRTSHSLSLGDAVVAAMRHAPNNLTVGEVRGAEALAALKGGNAGLDWWMMTIHANSMTAGLRKLEAYAREGDSQMDEGFLTGLIGDAVDLVVETSRIKIGKEDGKETRYVVTGIGRVAGKHGDGWRVESIDG